MKRMLKYFREFYKQAGSAVLLYFGLTIIHKFLAFISPPAIQHLIDSVVGGDSQAFFRSLVFNVFITVAFVAALYLRNLHGDITEGRVTAFAERRVFSDMLRMPYGKLRGKPLGHYLHLIDRDVDQITGLAFYDIFVFATNVIMTFAMLIYLINCDWLLSLIVIMVLPAFVIFTKVQLPRLKQRQEQLIEQQEALNDRIDECYSGNESIRASNAEGFFMKRFDGAVDSWLKAKKAYIKSDARYDILSITGLMNVANVAIYCLGCWRVLTGNMSLGTITTFSLYFSTLWNSVEGFMEFFKEYRIKQVSLARLDDMHEMTESTPEVSGADLPPFEKLCCEHISFAYGEREVIRDFSMEIRKGERVLITGDNGSGKSTIARLMTGLLIPNSGSMRYNDADISESYGHALREKVLLIPADPFIVEGTVGENMWGKQGGKALEQIDLSAHIDKSGGNLSSGQKKQLQLFRSLIAEAEVVIFDEPFNFVDKEAKADLWNEMLRTFAGRTLIVISHDPFPAKDCDRVIDIGSKQQ